MAGPTCGTATPPRTSSDVADHRRLYRFRTAEVDRFDPGADESFQRVRENDFTDGHDAVEALVHATRASASYPAVFEPVEETKELAARRHPPAAPAAETGQRGTAYLRDGGILDNAPIEPVIEEVGRRSVDGKVRRVLAYVVPSNGISPRVTPAPSAGAPKWTSVVAAALDLPRESDFRHDIAGLVEALGSDRTRVTTSVALLRRAINAAAGSRERSGLAVAATTLLSQYRVNRIAGSLREISTGMAERSLLPPQLRTASTPALDYSSVSAAWVPDEAPADASWTADPWPFGFSGALRTVRVLLSDTRRRIDDAPDEFGPLATQLGRVRSRIAALYEATAERVYGKVRGLPTELTPRDWDAAAVQAVNDVFRELGVAGHLSTQIDEAVTAYAQRCGLTAATLRSVLVTVEVVTGAVSGRSEDEPPPPFDFLRIGPDVANELYPGPGGKGDDKLFGTRLQHFGAFGSPDWRDRDFTWGRLDAAAHVTKLLGIDREQTIRLEQQVVDAEWEKDPAAFPAGFDKLAKSNTEILDELRSTDGGRDALRG